MGQEHQIHISFITKGLDAFRKGLRQDLDGVTKSLGGMQASLGKTNKALGNNTRSLGYTSRSLAKHKEAVAANTKAMAGHIAASNRLQKEQRETNTSLKGLTKEVGKLSKSMSVLTSREKEQTAQTGRWNSSLGKVVTRLLATAAAVLSVHAAIGQLRSATDVFGSVQTGLVSVQKTTDLADESLSRLNQRLGSLGVGELPILKTQMLEIGAAAGQLGVRGVDNLESYIETLGKLQVATDLAGEEGAKSLTRIMNVQGEGPENIKRLGSVIVELGNNAAASESEITHMSTQIALATAAFRPGSTVVAAFGAAMVESGIRAELGGNAIGRTLREIQEAVAEGGKRLDKFAEIAGVSAEEFSAAWKSDPVDALNLFLKGLGEFGEDATLALKQVGLGSDELNKVLPTLAANYDRLALRQKQAADEARNMVALDNEARRAFNTQERDLQRLANQWKLNQEAMGKGFSPALRQATVDLREYLSENERAARELGSSLGGALTKVTGLLITVADNLDLVATAAIALSVAFAAIKWNAQITAAYTYITALERLMGVQGLLAVSSARLGAAFSASGLFNPVALGAVALIGTIGLVNNAISEYADKTSRDIQTIVDASRDAQSQWEATAAAIEANTISSIDAQRKILSQQLSAELLAVEQTKEVLDEAIARNEELLRKASGQTLGAGLATLRQQEDVPALTEEYEKQKARIAQLESELAKLNKRRKEAKDDTNEETEAQRRLREELNKQQEKYAELIESLGLEKSALDGLTAAVMRGAEAFSAAQRNAEVERRYRAEIAKLDSISAEQKRRLKDAIYGVVEAEQRLAGAQTIANLQRQSNALERLIAAQKKGAQASKATASALALEESLRTNLAEATEDQRSSIESLTRSIQALNAISEARDTAEAWREEADALEQVAEAYAHSTAAGEAMERQLEAERQLNAAVMPLLAEREVLLGAMAEKQNLLALAQSGLISLSGEYQDELESEIDLLEEHLNLTEEEIEALKRRSQALQEARALADVNREITSGRERIEGMRHEVELLEKISVIKRDDFASQRAYEEAIRQVRMEHEIYVSSLQYEIQLKEALARLESISDPAKREAEMARVTDEIRIQQKETEELIRKRYELEKAAEDNGKSLRDTTGAMREIADIIGEIDSGLGSLIRVIADATDAWKRYAEAKAAGDQAGMDAAASDAYGAVGSYLGGALSGGGTSGFGGEMAGTYSAEGAEVGSYFGGYWAAVGAVLGAFIKKSGDKASVAVEKFGDQVVASVRYAEGGLKDAANDLSAGFNSFISDIQAQFGLAFDNLGGLEFNFTDRGILEVSGDQIGKAGFESVGEAAAYAAEQLLRLNAETNNLGENMTALLKSMGGEADFESLEQLHYALSLAAQADGQLMGEQVLRMQEISRQREADLQLATEMGLSYEMVLAVTDQRIAQLKAEVEATRASYFGAQEFVTGAQELVTAMTSMNAGIENEIESRERAIAAIEANQGALDDAAREAADSIESLKTSGLGRGGLGGDVVPDTGVFGEAAGGVQNLINTVGGLTGSSYSAADALESGRKSMAGTIGAATGMADAFEAAKTARFEEKKEVRETRQELFKTVDAAERAREEAKALRDSLSEIPRAFSADEIAAVWTKAADDAGLALIGLIRQVRGEEWGAAQERQLMTEAYRLQLAVQLQAVYQLLEATDMLRESTRAILMELAAQAESILANPNLSVRPRGGGGRGRDTGAQQRRETRDQFFEDLARFEELLSGVSESVLSYRDAIADIDRGIEEARKAGVAEDNLTRSRAAQVELLNRSILSPFENIASPSGPFGDLLSRYEDTVAVLREAAGSADDLAKSLFAIPAVLSDALANELGGQVRASLADMAEDGDALGIQDLISDLLAIDTSSMDPALASQVSGLIARLVADAVAVTTAIDAVSPSTGIRVAGVDTSAVNEFAAGLTDAQVELRAVQGAFASTLVQMRAAGASEEDLARLRQMHVAAIDNVRRSIMESIQQYTDVTQGIGEYERQLMDLQQTFADAAAGLASADAAEASLEDLYRSPDEVVAVFMESAQQLPDVVDDAMGAVAQVFRDRIPQAFGVDPSSAGGTPIDKVATDSAQRLAEALEDASDASLDLADNLSLVEQAQQDATRSLGRDFLRSLESLGVSLPTEVLQEMAEAEFALAQQRAISSALALAEAGAFEDLSISLEDLLDLIANADINASDFDLPSGGGSGGGGAGTYGDEATRILDSVRAAIEDWLEEGVGPVTQRAMDLNQQFRDLNEQLDYLRNLPVDASEISALRDQLEEAFDHVTNKFADEVLADMRDTSTGLQSEFNDLMEHFRDVEQAFDELGILAERSEELAEAQAAALQAFLDKATEGIRSFMEELRGEDPSVSAQENFQSAQDEYRDLLARAQGGDLDALEQLEGAAERFRDQARLFLGGGVGYQEVINELLAGLGSVLDLDPTLLNTGDGTDPDGGGDDGGISSGPPITEPPKPVTDIVVAQKVSEVKDAILYLGRVLVSANSSTRTPAFAARRGRPVQGSYRPQIVSRSLEYDSRPQRGTARPRPDMPSRRRVPSRYSRPSETPDESVVVLQRVFHSSGTDSHAVERVEDSVRSSAKQRSEEAKAAARLQAQRVSQGAATIEAVGHVADRVDALAEEIRRERSRRPVGGSA